MVGYGVEGADRKKEWEEGGWDGVGWNLFRRGRGVGAKGFFSCSFTVMITSTVTSTVTMR